MLGWHGFPIRSALEQRLDLKVRLMNDANAAALAEWRYGAGRNIQTMIFYTMSTGMGAGLIVGGRLHEGLDDLAGEIGHLAVSADGPVGFGRRGSLEGFCSGPGLSQLAVMKLTQARHEERDSLLLHLGKDYRLIGAEDVGKAAREGDVVALDVFYEIGLKLGQFSAFMVDILNPEAIVVGTIGRLYTDLILPQARAEIDRLSHPAAARRVRLLSAHSPESWPQSVLRSPNGIFDLKRTKTLLVKLPHTVVTLPPMRDVPYCGSVLYQHTIFWKVPYRS